MFLRSIALVAAATVAGSLAMPCSAQSADVHVTSGATARISYADLNLANEAGRARLERRIADAARTLCGSHAPMDLSRAGLTRACRTGAIASARLPVVLAAGGGGAPGYRMSLAVN